MISAMDYKDLKDAARKAGFELKPIAVGYGFTQIGDRIILRCKPDGSPNELYALFNIDLTGAAAGYHYEDMVELLAQKGAYDAERKRLVLVPAESVITDPDPTFSRQHMVEAFKPVNASDPTDEYLFYLREILDFCLRNWRSSQDLFEHGIFDGIDVCNEVVKSRIIVPAERLRLLESQGAKRCKTYKTTLLGEIVLSRLKYYLN